MARLYLVKHAAPAVDPDRPARAWPLCDEGRRRAADLGRRLTGRGIARCVTSDEPKAAETGAILSAVLGIPVAVAPGLHEQDRSSSPPSHPEAALPAGSGDDRDRGGGGGRAGSQGPMPFFADATAFEAAIAEVFARPGERVFGRESADEAHDRFAAALDRLLAAADGPLAVVSHGTVLSLFIARRTGLDGFALWKSLGLPSCAVLSLPDHQLLEILPPRAG